MAAELTPSKPSKTSSEKLVTQNSVNSVSRRDEWIKLNVGGTTFMTTRTTLSKDPKSFLFRLIQDEPDLNTDKVLYALSLSYSTAFTMVISFALMRDGGKD